MRLFLNLFVFMRSLRSLRLFLLSSCDLKAGSIIARERACLTTSVKYLSVPLLAMSVYATFTLDAIVYLIL